MVKGDLVLNQIGMAAVYLVCTKPFKSYFWELAFDDIVMGDCILNSNANKLKAAVNYKLFLLMPGRCYSWEDN